MAAAKTHDVVVVGAGVVGLATAYLARQQGLRVAVIERHAQCVGASVRNFGFITVTGQQEGEQWHRARRTLAFWQQVAPLAGIDIVHKGAYVVAQRAQAMQVLEAFMATDMAQGCRLLSPSELAWEMPPSHPAEGALHSPHECRVESRQAVAQLTRWLQHEMGVEFFWNTSVLHVDLPQVHTSSGVFHASHCVVCPGHDLNGLYPELMRQAGIRLCTLQMMRVQPAQPMRLPGAVMSDLSLVRYEGFAHLPEAAALKAQLALEQPEHLKNGIHLIAVQSADGSLVVGDSHVYGDAEAPFANADIDSLILAELQQVLKVSPVRVTERWTGVYASASQAVFKAQPAPGVAVGVVTSGTGASISFAFAQELLDMAMSV